MDWSSYYPAFVTTPEEIQANPQTDIDIDIDMGRVRPLMKNVEVADIGCGFGGLLVALAPVLPDTLLLGMLYLGVYCSTSNACVQAWKYGHKSLNMSKSESKLYELRIRIQAFTKILGV
jgi:tRNA G46 methylase TrmB